MSIPTRIAKTYLFLLLRVFYLLSSFVPTHRQCFDVIFVVFLGFFPLVLFKTQKILILFLLLLSIYHSSMHVILSDRILIANSEFHESPKKRTILFVFRKSNHKISGKQFASFICFIRIKIKHDVLSSQLSKCYSHIFHLSCSLQQ